MARNFGCVGSAGDDPSRITLIEKPGTPDERIWTWADFDTACGAVANHLVSRGIGMEDRVGLLMGNSATYLQSLYAIMRIGAVATPINPSLGDETIRFIIDDAGTEIILVDRDMRVRDQRARAVVIDDEIDTCSGSPFPAVDVTSDQPALQLYTSGTTGVPKGVVHSHASLTWAVHALLPQIDTGAVRTAVAAPLFHANGLFMSTLALEAGGFVALHERFRAREYLTAIADHRLTVISGVPTMFAMLLEHPDLIELLDLSSVQRILIGSAPMTVDLLQRTSAAFPNSVITNNYGTSEVPTIFGSHPAGLRRPFDSIGHPLAGVEVRLVGGETPDEGVLEVSSPSMMIGYHNQPTLTASRVSGGWYHTGDVLRRDGDGFYFFVGRSDDLMICGGENIYPSEVETLLERHPDVAVAAVVPMPDERKGVVPVAFVALRARSACTPGDIKEFALANGPAYSHPRVVVIIDLMPLQANGKVNKQVLVERARSMTR